MPSYQYIYVMKQLGKTYPGGRELFKNISLSFFPDAKIGVLGLNGAGKSTLLRIMAGIETEFSGEAWAADGASVGFLPQEPQLDPDKNVAGNVMEGVGEVMDLLDRFNEVGIVAGIRLERGLPAAEQVEQRQYQQHQDNPEGEVTNISQGNSPKFTRPRASPATQGAPVRATTTLR